MEGKALEKATYRVGRKPVINTTMAQSDIDRLDAVCKKHKTTKGRLISSIVLEWLDKYEAEQEAMSDSHDN
ncbi:MAG: hypothetical protein J6X53_03190 [Abditibacteriota bacterium]|nr:hypothetical protein [Abditibacteriota bacterium]